MDHAAERAAVVQEALSWQRTPYHHQGRIKGAGVDCGQLLAAVYEASGVVPRINPDAYPQDWHMHRSEERYLGHVQQYATEIQGPPQPGDIAVWRFGRTFSHGAIVIEWPRILHAYVGLGVVQDNALANQDLSNRLVRFFSPWGD